MEKACPEKTFISAPGEGGCSCSECPYMKLNSMEKLYLCMRDRKPEITLDEDLAEARLAAHPAHVGDELAAHSPCPPYLTSPRANPYYDLSSPKTSAPATSPPRQQFPPAQRARGELIAKTPLVLAGIDIFAEVFQLIEPATVAEICCTRWRDIYNQDKSLRASRRLRERC